MPRAIFSLAVLRQLTHDALTSLRVCGPGGTSVCVLSPSEAAHTENTELEKPHMCISMVPVDSLTFIAACTVNTATCVCMCVQKHTT